QLSPQEADKLLNRFHVTPEIFKEIFESEDPAVAVGGLNKLVRGIVQEAVTAAQVLTQYTKIRFFNRFSPTSSSQNNSGMRFWLISIFQRTQTTGDLIL